MRLRTNYNSFLWFSLVLAFFFLCFIHSKIVQADQDSYDRAIHKINSMQSQIPNEKVFFQICADPSINLDFKERSFLYQIIKSKQKPLIKRTELLELFNAKRNAIHDCFFEYSVNVIIPKDLPDQEAGQFSYSYIFAFKNNKFYKFKKGKRWETDIENIITAYDGEITRLVRSPENDMPSAEISDKQSLYIFDISHLPLKEARLANPIYYDEFDNYHTFLADKRICFFSEEIDNIKCEVATDIRNKVYFDPEKDFSIVRYEEFEPLDLSSMNSIVVNGTKQYCRKMNLRCNLSNYRDFGNGIWIPHSIETTEFHNDKESVIIKTTVDVAKINEGISDEFFADIIPENSFVIDSVRKMTYMQQDSPSIDSLLKNVVKSKRVYIFRYISVAFGLVLIILALVMKYRNSRKNRNAT